MTREVLRPGRMRIPAAPFAFSLLLLLASSRPAAAQDAFGEVLEVRTGFTRVTVADANDRPRPDDFRVSWKRTPQTVREILGGPGSPIEIGIAIDRSASMHESLDAMKAAIRDFLDKELSAADRVFVLGFFDRVELVAEGFHESLSAIANLAIDRRPGTRPTRFYEGLESALSQFRNTSPRAVLVVASDGCDSLQEEAAGQHLLARAADLAIPIVLIAPNQRECLNTKCEATASGEWSCTEVRSAGTVRLGSRDPFDPTRPPAELPASLFSSPATITRDRFVARLKAGEGGFVLARSESGWRRGLDSVRSLLDRQWTVVFEPSSEEVRSSEVRVKIRRGSRPAVPVDRAIAMQDDDAKVAPVSQPLSAADPVPSEPPLIQDQIGVEVVSVDVVATDRRGRRILDLAREELQIEVDGRKQSLDYFAPPQGIAPEDVEALEIPPNVRPAPGGTVFLVLDRATLDGRDLNRVIGSFGNLASAPGLVGRTFVVASFAGAPMIHAPGTTELDQVRRALEDAGRAGARGEIRRLERQHLQDDVRSATPAIAELLAVQLQAFEEQEISQQAAFLAMIQDLVATSADSDQPNTLLIASEGFSAEPARYLREIAKEVAGRQSGTLLSRLDAAPTRYLYVLDELEKLAQTLQERRVTAYTLIPTSGFSMGSWSPAHRSSGRSPAASPREDMDLTESAANAATLADSTGGSRIPISTDLKERIGAIALDRRASYSLGFTTGPEAGFESHEIRISTSRRGVSLRHRASYRRLSQSEQWQSALAAAARAGIVNAALPIAVRVEPAATRPADDGRSRRVPVVLDIPLAQLSFRPSPDRSSDVTTLTFQLAVNNAAGALVRGPEEAIEISVPHADLERARADSWTHRVEVELPAGPAGIGALLIERSTGAWATASCTVSADD